MDSNNGTRKNSKVKLEGRFNYPEVEVTTGNPYYSEARDRKEPQDIQARPRTSIDSAHTAQWSPNH